MGPGPGRPSARRNRRQSSRVMATARCGGAASRPLWRRYFATAAWRYFARKACACSTAACELVAATRISTTPSRTAHMATRSRLEAGGARGGRTLRPTRGRRDDVALSGTAGDRHGPAARAPRLPRARRGRTARRAQPRTARRDPGSGGKSSYSYSAFGLDAERSAAARSAAAARRAASRSAAARSAATARDRAGGRSRSRSRP